MAESGEEILELIKGQQAIEGLGECCKLPSGVRDRAQTADAFWTQ